MRWDFASHLLDGDLLLELFPCARVILNWRDDVVGQLGSGFFGQAAAARQAAEKQAKEAGGEAKPAGWQQTPETLRAYNAEMAAFGVRHPLHSMRMTTEELNTANLDRMIAWLGFSHCAVNPAGVQANANNSYSGLPKGGKYSHVTCK